MPIKFQFRRDIDTEWSTANTVLADGEFGYDKSSKRFKIGDGTTAWNNLSYVGGEASSVSNVAVAANTVFDASISYIRTAGYRTVGDGGGALYKRYTGGGSPPTGVNTRYITSSGGNIWELVTDQQINILQFGADNSGTLSANAAFQAAVDATTIGFGTQFSNLLIPPGNYRFSNTVQIPDGRRITWKGLGDARLYTTDNIILIEHSRQNTANFTTMTLENLWIEKVGGAGSAIGVKWAGYDTGNTQTQLLINKRDSRVKMIDCEMRGFWRAVQMSWSSGGFYNSYHVSNLADFFFERGASFIHLSNIITQLGEYFIYGDDPYLPDAEGGPRGGDGITNSFFIEQCLSVFKKGDIRIVGFDAVNIVGGGCDLGGQDANGAGEAAIYLVDCTNTNITNQYISSATGAAGQPNARQNRIGVELIDCLVTHIIGNRIVDNAIGIRMSGPTSEGTNILISNNNFRNNRLSHISANNSRAGRILGNSFDSTPPRTGNDLEIYLPENSTGWIVSENIFESNTTLNIPSANNLIGHNLFDIGPIT